MYRTFTSTALQKFYGGASIMGGEGRDRGFIKSYFFQSYARPKSFQAQFVREVNELLQVVDYELARP